MPDEPTMAQRIHAEHDRSGAARLRWTWALVASVGILLVAVVDGPRMGNDGFSNHVAFRSGSTVAVVHTRSDLPFPLVLRCTDGQWERLRATLPDSVTVEIVQSAPQGT